MRIEREAEESKLKHQIAFLVALTLIGVLIVNAYNGNKELRRLEASIEQQQCLHPDLFN